MLDVGYYKNYGIRPDTLSLTRILFYKLCDVGMKEDRKNKYCRGTRLSTTVRTNYTLFGAHHEK